MAIVMLMQWPGVTKDDYDRAMDALRLDDNAPEGGIFHVAGAEGDNWRVLDIWESEDAWNSFRDNRLMPALQQTGLLEKGEPNVLIYQVHNVYAPRRDELARMGASSLAGTPA